MLPCVTYWILAKLHDIFFIHPVYIYSKLFVRLSCMDNFRQSQLNCFSSGGRDSLNGTSNDGWITTGKSAKAVLIDQTKLWNMAKVISVPVVRRTDSSIHIHWIVIF
jgi:hypothetical protein